MKLVRVNIMLGVEHHAFLKAYADEKGLSESIVIRQLAQQLMDEQTKPHPLSHVVHEATGRFIRVKHEHEHEQEK